MALILQNIDDKDVTVETRGAYPSHFLLKIESFTSLSGKGVKQFESDEFEAGGYKWRLIIFPNGQETTGNNNDVHLSAYLALSNSSSLPAMWEVNAIFGIFLYNRKSDNFICKRGKTQRFHEMSLACGFSNFISRKSFMDPSNGYLTNDTCTFGAEVFIVELGQGSVQCMSATHFVQSWMIHSFSELENEWQSEKFEFGGQNWLMKVFTRGDSLAKDTSISIYLQLVELKHQCTGVHVNFTFTIKDQINGKKHHQKKSTASGQWFDQSPGKSSWGWRNFISITDMNDPAKGYVVNDCCVIELDMSVGARTHSLS